MMIQVDFHTHTNASPDSLASVPSLVRVAARHKLDRMVITDHNTLAGVRRALSLAQELIIPGEEIKTTRGEILAAFVIEEVPAGLKPQEAIHRLREQGAFISVSHPFDIRSGAWSLEDLLEITPLVDAIEVFNSRCMKPDANQLAAQFASQHALPGTAGSDAHVPFELGRAVVELPEFQSADDLRRVIAQGRITGRVSPLWVHFISRYARLRKRLGYNSVRV
jgi:hypothetical protein